MVDIHFYSQQWKSPGALFIQERQENSDKRDLRIVAVQPGNSAFLGFPPIPLESVEVARGCKSDRLDLIIRGQHEGNGW